MEILYKTFWSIFVAIGFAILFNTPRKALWTVAFLGALGYGTKVFLLTYIIYDHTVLSTLAGASMVGILAIYIAEQLRTSPIIFTVPSVICMIPGKFGYEFIIGIIKIAMVKNGRQVSFDYFLEVVNSGLKTGLILMALALGIIFPILFFNTRTVKDKDLTKIINKKVIRKFKIFSRHHH